MEKGLRVSVSERGNGVVESGRNELAYLRIRDSTLRSVRLLIGQGTGGKGKHLHQSPLSLAPPAKQGFGTSNHP
jgi:hypothetical protein